MITKGPIFNKKIGVLSVTRYVKEQERSLPVKKSCDVLIAGGGVAGISAAIAAARCGAKVVLLERQYLLGGLATLGNITIYMPMDDGKGHQAQFGIVEELFRLSIKHGAETTYPSIWLEDAPLEARSKTRMSAQFNPHFFALEAEKLLTELGVTILYGALACGVTMEGNRIQTVIVETISGRSAIAAKAVIDSTGDSHICQYAGAKTAEFSRGSGLASWYYYFSNQQVRLRMYGMPEVTISDEEQATLASAGNEKVEIPGKRYNPLDEDQLSEMLILSHQSMLGDILQRRKEDPQLVPVTMSTIPLLRMTRRLEGALVMDDLEYTYMEDSIGTISDWRRRGYVYELPFRCLYGGEVPNLLVAGRNISVTESMWDITRVIPPCVVTGQAAGVAASLTSDFPSLDVGKLQQKLAEQGVRLHCDDILP